jgi:hypothetical protein
MPEPELYAKAIRQYFPACEAGRHVLHPGETCEEWEEYAAAARALYEGALIEAISAQRLLEVTEVPAALLPAADVDPPDGIFAALHAAVDATVTRALVDGDGTGEILGFRIFDAADPEPTPTQRALAILDTELRRCPLYDAGPPVLYPPSWKARP